MTFFTIRAQTYIHTERQTGYVVIKCEFGGGRGGGVDPALIAGLGLWLFSPLPFLLKVTIPDISSKMSDPCLWLANSSCMTGSWGLWELSKTGQRSLFCFIYWPEQVNNDHTTQNMVTNDTLCERVLHNNRMKAQTVWLQCHRICKKRTSEVSYIRGWK